MPTKVQCPNPECGLSASVSDDDLGRAARCKRCGTRFTLSASQDGSPPPSAETSAGGAPLTILGRYQVRETLLLKGHTSAVMSVAFSPDGKRIVSGSQDNTVKVWDATPSP